jgi:myo-inositol 2-dehydrogenase/D-chiro-inositol 1-dehydrogenase
VVEVYATGAALSDPRFAELGDIDTALVTLRFASGALGVIDNSRSAGYGYECSTEVVGSAATVRIENPPPRHYRWLTPGSDARGIPRDFQERYPLAYQAELEGFARAVLTGSPVAVGGADALAAYDLAVAADRSWRTGLPVRVNAPD